MPSFSDLAQFHVDSEVRLSMRVSDKKVDEYHLPREDVLAVIQNPVPGPEWVEAYTIKVKEGMLAIRASGWKWDIYTMSVGSLITLVAQLRAELGVD